MKKLIILLVLVVGFCTLPNVSMGQSTGRWVENYDPQTGHRTMKFVPNRVQRQPVPNVYVQNVQVVQVMPVVVAQYPRQRQRPRYTPKPSTSYQPRDYNRPVYHDQQVNTVEQEWDVGLNPYNGRPYANFRRSSRTTTIRITQSSETFRPEFRIDYYGTPSYRRWY